MSQLFDLQRSNFEIWSQNMTVTENSDFFVKNMRLIQSKVW